MSSTVVLDKIVLNLEALGYTLDTILVLYLAFGSLATLFLFAGELIFFASEDADKKPKLQPSTALISAIAWPLLLMEYGADSYRNTEASE